MKRKRITPASIMEEIVFGVEDSLVSTLGAITGIAVGTQDPAFVLFSGAVIISAETLSMMAGSYLSSRAEQELWVRHRKDEWEHVRKEMSRRPLEHALRRQLLKGSDAQEIIKACEEQEKNLVARILRHEHDLTPIGTQYPLLSAAVMGVSYLLAGIIPILAYVFLPVEAALIPSIIVTCVALFLFGIWKARVTHTVAWRSGLEMLLVAMIAGVMGFVVGGAIKVLFF
ncbi:VIT1/CCC1 transporter family protein [Candidatus Uhrbacteria bacterium]|nr:VIT1/CCC1 transporter family protein [Candidatus Uhrbacteria bacterium]